MSTPRSLRLIMIPVTLLLLCWSTQAFAGAPIRQAGNFGIGVGGGTNTVGLSMKYFMSQANSLQFIVGFRNGYGRCDYYYDGRRRCGRYGSDHIGLSADYLFELPTFVQSEVLDIGPAAGFGAGLGLWDGGIDLAINGVLGLEFMLNPVPIDFVIEWRPNVLIIPGVDLNLVDFTGHVRFYF